MAVQESGEMYLEAIYVLSRRGAVRAIDVGEYLGYSKPSVSRAMGILKSGGYITVAKDGFIALTDAGFDIARDIYEKHTIITKFLVSLGVDKETAAEDACRIEHHISDVSFKALKRYTENI
ncbi:MAG: metal-dependent transcriptional regulator [Ruminococcaceae bacterium]|nr:metal-dependent transcriptional regulator [Oscillospiraceae bacterium]